MKLLCRIAFIGLFSFAAQANAPAGARLYMISQTNLKISKGTIAPKVVETSAEHAIVQLTAVEVTKLSHHFHEEINICGGYIDITDEFARSKKDMKSFLADEARIPVATFDKTEPTFPEQVKMALTKFDKTRYWSFLTQLSALPNRNGKTPEGARAAQLLGDHALKIASDLGRTDVTVKYIPTPGYLQPSTLIKVAGKNPALPATLMGAHMDTINSKIFGSRLEPGADDDGTGTSTVMEVYHAVLSSRLKFDRDMYFAFYAAEEHGLIGSGVMARAFVAEGIKVRGVLQFDMTGYKAPQDILQIYFINDNVDPAMTTFLKKLTVNYVGIPMDQIGDDKCGYACSDHAQWQRNGYPAAFPFESSFRNDNKAIHSATDLMNILDVEHSSKYAKLGIAFAVETADPLPVRK
ncbi:MAG: M28 family peptidase [Bdellovibrionales bacterium]